MITIENSSKNGFFRVDGIDYQKRGYVLKQDNKHQIDDQRSFSLCSIFDGEKIITSRVYTEITGVNSWDELLQLLSEAEALQSNDIYMQDQHSEIIDLYMCRMLGNSNPSGVTVINSVSIVVDSVVGAAVGDCIEITENGRLFQGVVKSVVGNTVTFNAPTDQEFTTEAIVSFGEWNMNGDGSGVTLTYKVQPPAGSKWDITRIIFGMLDDSPMDDGKFGGIASLPNGIVLRVFNGCEKNIFVVNDNGGLRERSFDVEYADKAPAGDYGFGCRRTFGGQDKNGVTIRLDGDTNCQLQMLVRDDLTQLLKLAVVVQGHRVI